MHFSSIVAIAALTFSFASAQKVSTDGTCGNGVTCTGSKFGNCCSKWGWCGSNAHFCNAGCQSASGTCGSVVGSGQSRKGSQAKIAAPASSSTTMATVTRAAFTPLGYQLPPQATPAVAVSVSIST